MVVANGHYRFPRFPDIPGLDKWLAAGKATHSAWYRRPADSGNTFLIVGRNISGRDIATEMASQPSTSVVYLSVREPPLKPLRDSTEAKLQSSSPLTETIKERYDMKIGLRMR